MKKSSRDDLDDLIKWKRFGHWVPNAQKARFSAFILWEIRSSSEIEDYAARCESLTGDLRHGVYMGFLRESGIALELAIKAKIAYAIENEVRSGGSSGSSVPATHDLLNLWKTAQLPEPSSLEAETLACYKSVLYWQGRYASPKTSTRWEDELLELEAVQEYRTTKVGNIRLKKAWMPGWQEFDALFQQAIP